MNTSATITVTGNEPFVDPLVAAVKENLSRTIRDGMASIIPPEMYDRIANEAVNEFIFGSSKRRFKIVSKFFSRDDSDNPHPEKMSGTYAIQIENPDYDPFQDETCLKGMVMKEIMSMGQEAVKKLLSEHEDFKQAFDSKTGQYFTKALNDIIKDNVDAFIVSMFSNMVQRELGPHLLNMRNRGY